MIGLKVKVNSFKEASSLLFLLQIVSEISATKSFLIENFGSLLLRIGHVMLGDHVQGSINRANKKRKSRSYYSNNQNNNNTQNNSNNDVRTDLACREYFEDSCLSYIQNNIEYDTKSIENFENGRKKDKKKDSSNSKNNSNISNETKNNENKDDNKDDKNNNPLEELSGRILTCCLHVLFQSIDQGYMEQQKPVIVSLLAATIEGSENILLINLASNYCLKWIGHSKSPLSLGEQVVVFSRICCHSMKIQLDCKQAIIARFSIISERIGELTSYREKMHNNFKNSINSGIYSNSNSNSSPNSGLLSKNSFDNSDNRLGVLALLSPNKKMRESCQNRVFNNWGPTLFSRLKKLFSADLSSEFHSRWPSLIVSLALGAVDYNYYNKSNNGINDDDKKMNNSNNNDGKYAANENYEISKSDDFMNNFSVSSAGTYAAINKKDEIIKSKYTERDVDKNMKKNDNDDTEDNDNSNSNNNNNNSNNSNNDNNINNNNNNNNNHNNNNNNIDINNNNNNNNNNNIINNNNNNDNNNNNNNINNSTIVWLKSIGDFVLCNPSSGFQICLQLLQKMWTEINDKKRDELSLLIANNIMQSKHSIPINMNVENVPIRNYKTKTIPQDLIQLFSKLIPTPHFPIEFLSCLGLYGCEGEVAPLLESMIINTNNNKTLKRLRTSLLATLDKLDDRDTVRAVLRSSTSSLITDAALSLETFGRIDLSQLIIIYGINVSTSDDMINSTSNSNSNSNNLSSILNSTSSSTSNSNSNSINKNTNNIIDQLNDHIAPFDDDIELWEWKWINNSKCLLEWKSLNSFSSATGMPDIYSETSIAIGDWENFKRLKNSINSSNLLLNIGLKNKMYDCMLGIIEKKYNDTNDTIHDCKEIILYQWLQYPNINNNNYCYRNLLVSIQQIIELEESKNILLNIQNYSSNNNNINNSNNVNNNRMLPDISIDLLKWRNRLPDISENILKWDTIIQWRINLFNNIKRNLRGAHDEVTLADLTDIPWSTLQLVRAARKHEYHNVGLKILQSLQNVSTLDVTDAFNKVREQILLCLSSDLNGNATGGLNVINNTNLDFFDVKQRAEIFRLKGICNNLLGYSYDAHDCYSRCIQLSGKGEDRDWLSWSNLCYSTWEKESFQYVTMNKGDDENNDSDRSNQYKIDNTDIKSGIKVHDLSTNNISSIKFCFEHAISCLVCVLKSIECDSIQGRLLLPRVLWILHSSYCIVENEIGKLEFAKNSQIYRNENTEKEVDDDLDNNDVNQIEIEKQNKMNFEINEKSQQLIQLINCFINHSIIIPKYVFLPYVSSLLAFLHKKNGELFLPLLYDILNEFPQEIIGHLFYENENENENENDKFYPVNPTSSSFSSVLPEKATSSNTSSKNLLRNLKEMAIGNHNSVWTRMEWLCGAIQKTVPSASNTSFNTKISFLSYDDDKFNNNKNGINNSNNSIGIRHNSSSKKISIQSYNYFEFDNNNSSNYHNSNQCSSNNTKLQNGLHIPIQFLPFGCPKDGRERPQIVRVCFSKIGIKGQDPGVRLLGSDGMFYSYHLTGFSEAEKIKAVAQV